MHTCLCLTNITYRYNTILSGIEKLDNDVPGWFDQHSGDLFIAAA